MRTDCATRPRFRKLGLNEVSLIVLGSWTSHLCTFSHTFLTVRFKECHPPHQVIVIIKFKHGYESVLWGTHIVAKKWQFNIFEIIVALPNFLCKSVKIKVVMHSKIQVKIKNTVFSCN